MGSRLLLGQVNLSTEVPSVWWCWLVATCRAGCRSQGYHGTSLLCLVFLEDPHRTLVGDTSSQAYQLAMSLNAVKCNLTELTTKNGCVPSRVCRIVMHTCQCIHLCQCSFMPNSVLWGICTSACGRGLCSLAFCVVCSCTCASACVEPALVSLCSQRSSVIHIHTDPLCLL